MYMMTVRVEREKKNEKKKCGETVWTMWTYVGRLCAPDRYSGKILHIDFGDCFEASMHREKFPERVPFRLTRMLVRAMEVSGIEGNFRSTCEGVMAGRGAS